MSIALPDFAVLAEEALGGVRAPEAENGSTDQRILDATVVLLGEYGERRLTMDDVAAEAELARATIFRRFGSKEALISQAYQREVQRAIVATREAADGADGPRAALSAGLPALIELAATHPITRRVARVEPDAMVELWRDGTPSGMVVIKTLLATIARDSPGGDAVAAEQLDYACETLARLMLSLMLVDEGRDRGNRAAFVERLVTDLLEPATTHRRRAAGASESLPSQPPAIA